jgi:hypothetical protein
MKKLVFVLFAVFALTPAMAQRKNSTKQVIPHWQTSTVCSDPGCTRAALWYGPEGNILLKWFGIDLMVSIREKTIEQELCLTSAGTSSLYRELVVKPCTECEPLKNGERAQLRNWVLINDTPSPALVAKPWVQAALQALPKEETQARSLLKNEGGKP